VKIVKTKRTKIVPEAILKEKKHKKGEGNSEKNPYLTHNIKLGPYILNFFQATKHPPPPFFFAKTSGN
jgi:hypothetical protein